MTLSTKATTDKTWKTICGTTDLVKDSGISALIANSAGEDEQVAIFHIPNSEEKIFAVGNYDPIGEANVLYRGLVGCIDDEPVVSSPLYKQHYSLKTGRCLQEEKTIAVYDIRIENEQVQLFY
ncbi:nitrite reductase (NAD(P)H) small subunit [Colwellia sp. 75C3]|jgi:nitrite reductase (NADH) small subunit|uniref:nitrite reductase small subunit NirD n=1 Tax=Colwellia sp. 75C3 TaxID=888425 RepID=UPI000C34330D|nr:nitrite reductase small subunit NirD [Colwellia sp. 75C3]PKG81371.1 nitrite reductase (NAD(P)H) small subunit [Colwellia sp. 75C3]